LLSPIKIAIGIFASMITWRGLQFSFGPASNFWVESALRGKSAEIAAKKQNARREFPPGVMAQCVRFFSWLLPSVKTENATMHLKTVGCSKRYDPCHR